MVAILCGHERHFWIHPSLFMSCLQMGNSLSALHSRHGSLEFVAVQGTTPVDAARNAAVSHLLKSGADWLLQIDNDTVPADGFLTVLNDIGTRKIVGFPYVGLTGGGKLSLCVGNKVDGAIYEAQQLQIGWSEVDAIGSGCLLVHRDVFESLGDPWFECSRRIELQERVYAGEDFTFCEKAKANGFKVWTHSAYPARHYRTVELTMLNQVQRQ